MKTLDTFSTKEEFIEAFKAAMKQILTLEKKLVEKLNNDSDVLKTDFGNTRKIEKGDFDKLTSETQKITDKLFKEQADNLNFLQDKVRSLKNGKDADEEVIVGKVLKNLPEPKILTAKEMRDALETLLGEDELKLTTIDSLKKEMENLKQNVQNIGQRRLVGGTPHNMTHVKDLTSQCDGTNKTFYVDSYKKPLLLLCPDFPTIYRPNTDYTLANKTLTLTSEVDAPQDGQTLLFMYVK